MTGMTRYPFREYYYKIKERGKEEDQNAQYDLIAAIQAGNNRLSGV